MIDQIKTVIHTQRMLIIGTSVVGLVLAGLGLALASTSDWSASAPLTTDPAFQPTIPPIDAASTETETATFALG